MMDVLLIDESKDAPLNPIDVINQLVQDQPGVKPVSEVEPEVLFIYNRLIPVECKLILLLFLLRSYFNNAMYSIVFEFCFTGSTSLSCHSLHIRSTLLICAI